MSQLRIIYDNAADSATLTASSTAGSLVASNMKSNIKSRVWRSTSTTATLSATLSTEQPVNGVVLAFTNLSSSCTIQVTCTNRSGVVYTSPTVMGSAPTALGDFEWGDTLGDNAYSGDTPLAASNFSQGRYSYARLWFDNTYFVSSLVITITDDNNSAGYVEVGKLIVGKSWSPVVGTEVGATDLTSEDSTDTVRNDSGDLITDTGTIHRVIGVNFPSLSARERDNIWKMLRNNAKNKPILLSAFADDSDSVLEQMFMIFGNMSDNKSLGIPYSKTYFETDIEMEEI